MKLRNTFKKITGNKLFLLLIILLVGINIFLIHRVTANDTKDKVNSAPTAKEIDQIRTTRDPKMQSRLYTALIERVGPRQAQDDLYKSGLPFDGQTHLLNHTIGNWLYGKYGNDGLIYCQDYFLSSCYHGFVIKAIADKGTEILDPIMTSCWKEGATTATQCAHAIGHGLLAWEGYKDLPKALKECDELGIASKNFPVFNCQDGVFMENIWAVHNDGTPSKDRWVKKDDPLYPCSDPQIGQAYQRACWTEQPSIMYQLFQGDLKKVASECLKLTDDNLQWTCFDSIARQINPLSGNSIPKLHELCDQMPSKWANECIYSNVSTFYSIGDRTIPFQICPEFINAEEKNTCYNRLLNIIIAYSKTENEKNTICNKIYDKNWLQKCKLAKLN